MTYNEMYNSFFEKTNIDRSLIVNYRPCCEMYDVPNISNAILIWLRSGEKIIFIAKEK